MDKDITEPQSICNTLNNYFCSVGLELVQSLNPCGQSDFKKYCPFPCKNSMFCSSVTPDEISRIIHKFPNNKAPGRDQISGRILKEISDSVITPLAYIQRIRGFTSMRYINRLFTYLLTYLLNHHHHHHHHLSLL